MTGPGTWQHRRLLYIRGLSHPNSSQQRILALTERHSRTPKDERELSQLWRRERNDDRSLRLKRTTELAEQGKKSSERRARTRRLIELGALVDLAAINQDRGVLLGGLLWLADALKAEGGPERSSEWKRRGDALLKEREVLSKFRRELRKTNR